MGLLPVVFFFVLKLPELPLKACVGQTQSYQYGKNCVGPWRIQFFFCSF